MVVNVFQSGTMVGCEGDGSEKFRSGVGDGAAKLRLAPPRQ